MRTWSYPLNQMVSYLFYIALHISGIANGEKKLLTSCQVLYDKKFLLKTYRLLSPFCEYFRVINGLLENNFSNQVSVLFCYTQNTSHIFLSIHTYVQVNKSFALQTFRLNSSIKGSATFKYSKVFKRFQLTKESKFKISFFPATKYKTNWMLKVYKKASYSIDKWAWVRLKFTGRNKQELLF